MLTMLTPVSRRHLSIGENGVISYPVKRRREARGMRPKRLDLFTDCEVRQEPVAVGDRPTRDYIAGRRPSGWGLTGADVEAQA